MSLTAESSPPTKKVRLTNDENLCLNSKTFPDTFMAGDDEQNNGIKDSKESKV